MRGCINEYKQLNPDLSSTERFIAGIQATVSKKAVRSKIAEFGGLDWLQSCSFASKVSPQMSGKSLDSGFIRIVIAAYESKEISAAVDLHQSSPQPAPIAVVESGTMIQSLLPPESEIKFSVPVSNAGLNNQISPEIAPVIDAPKPKISLDDLVPLKAKKLTVDRAAVTLQILDTLRNQNSRDYEERNFRYLLRNSDSDTPVLEVLEDDRVVFSSEATGYDDRGEVIWEISVFELGENFFNRTEGMASEVLRPMGVSGDSLKETLRERANSVSR
jgi:hypothetical protein